MNYNRGVKGNQMTTAPVSKEVVTPNFTINDIVPYLCDKIAVKEMNGLVGLIASLVMDMAKKNIADNDNDGMFRIQSAVLATHLKHIRASTKYLPADLTEDNPIIERCVLAAGFATAMQNPKEALLFAHKLAEASRDTYQVTLDFLRDRKELDDEEMGFVEQGNRNFQEANHMCWSIAQCLSLWED
jgi:hypothetical protein